MSAGDTNPNFDGIIAEYLRLVESGDAPDREELIGRHPDLADNLKSFFANQDRMKQATSEDSTLPPSATPAVDATIAPGNTQIGVPSSRATTPSPGENSTGLVGFIISISGLFCAVGFPIGLIVSLAGLKKEPRGFAIAGIVIGATGTMSVGLVLVIWGAMIAAAIGIGIEAKPYVENVLETVQESVQTRVVMDEARNRVNGIQRRDRQFPENATGTELIGNLKDAWGNPLRYELGPNADQFVIRSAGADGQFHTADDPLITSQVVVQGAIETSSEAGSESAAGEQAAEHAEAEES